MRCLQLILLTVHVNLYEYWDLVRDSSVITQQISTVALFVGTFFHVYYNSLSEYMLLATNAVCAVVGIGLLYVSGASTESMSRFGGLGFTSDSHGWSAAYQLWKQVTFFVGTLLGLSPVLRTLYVENPAFPNRTVLMRRSTNQYSNDTIWALSVILLLVHLCLHDYSQHQIPGQPRYDQKQSSCSSFLLLSLGMHSLLDCFFLEEVEEVKFCRIVGTVALNAAMFASVLLASRLPSTLHVFALVALATQLFAMSPMLRRSLRVRAVWPPSVDEYSCGLFECDRGKPTGCITGLM